tara:strand:- start:183 stop:404 length:222 start_codon:yes stop_codon:yes gene_type:complete
MGKVQDLDIYFKKMRSNVKIRDMNDNIYLVKDIKIFIKHIKDYHNSGSSIHEENGFYFFIDDQFRNFLFNLET